MAKGNEYYYLWPVLLKMCVLFVENPKKVSKNFKKTTSLLQKNAL